MEDLFIYGVNSEEFKGKNMTLFRERAQEMGLDVTYAYRGMYSYQDQYSQIVFRQVGIPVAPEDPNPPHITCGNELPYLAIYTKDTTQAGKYYFCGLISELYKFVGNNNLMNIIRNSIQQVGIPIISEINFIPPPYTRFRSELAITSSVRTQQVGDVIPVMIVNNSYNGTHAASLSFGISFKHGPELQETLVFGFSLGEMRQIHNDYHSSSVSGPIGTYVQGFTQHIEELISTNFNRPISEDTVFTTLDMIEKIGKRRRGEVSKLLNDMRPPVIEGQPPQPPTAWQVFLAIVRYSSLEANLNAKKMLENIAESVLIIPMKMIDTLKQIEN
jgi:hypothetical protein